MSALALVAEPPLSPARAELKRLQSEFARPLLSTSRLGGLKRG
jgi:hypothetical protein